MWSKRFEKCAWARDEQSTGGAWCKVSYNLALLKWQDKRGVPLRAVSFKELLTIPLTPYYSIFLCDEERRSVFCNCFMLRNGTEVLEWKVSTWAWNISLLTVLVTYLHMWAEQATIILMPTKIKIIMSSSVNPILLRPLLWIVLAINTVLLKMEHLMSWLQSWSSYS